MKKYLIPIILIICLSFTGCVYDTIYSDVDIAGNLTVSGNTTTAGLTLSDTVWDDLRTPVNSIRVVGVKSPAWTGAYGGQVLAFSDQAVVGNEEEVYFNLQIPHTYVDGTDLYVHIHYTYSVNQTNTSSRWGLEYTWTNMDAIIGVSSTIYFNTILTNNNANVHYKGKFPVINGAGKELSSMLVCRLFRNSSNISDNFTNNVYLLEVDAHYEINKLGSPNE